MSPVSNTEYLDLYPSNDMYVDAVTLTGQSGSITGHLMGTTVETDEDEYGGRYYLYNDSLHSVWYKWTPAISGDFYFQVNNEDTEVDFTLDVTKDSTDAASGMVIAISDNKTQNNYLPRLAVRVQSGVEYYIRVGSPSYEEEFILEWGPTIVPVNSQFPDAIDLLFPEENVVGTTWDGLTELALSRIDGSYQFWMDQYPSAWYRYTNRTSKPVLFAMLVTPAPGSDCTFGTEIFSAALDYNDSQILDYVNPDEESAIVVEPGQTIYIAVLDDWFMGGMGSFTFSWDLKPVPYEDVAAVVTAYDPTNDNLALGTSGYGIYGIEHEGAVQPIVLNTIETPRHPIASVISRSGNVWYIDQQVRVGGGTRYSVKMRKTDGTDLYKGNIPITRELTTFTPKLMRHDGSPYNIWQSFVSRPDETNLFPAASGSFEIGTTNGWTALPQTIITASQAQAAHGQWSLRMVYSGSGQAGPNYLIIAESPLIDLNATGTRPANNYYFAWAEFRWANWIPEPTFTGTRLLKIQLNFYNSSMVSLPSTNVFLDYHYGSRPTTSTAWNQSNSGSSYAFTMNPSARYVKFWATASGVQANTEIFVDKVGLFEDPHRFISEPEMPGAPLDTWQIWGPEGVKQSLRQYRAGYQDPNAFGAGLGGKTYGKSFGPEQYAQDGYKLAQTAGTNTLVDEDGYGGDFDTYGIYPDDPTTKVDLHFMEFQDSVLYNLYTRNTLDNTLTGTLATYLTSIHNGVSYPWMKLSDSGPGEEVRLVAISNGNLFFATELANCVYNSVAFEITTAGELVAVYPDTKMATYPFVLNIGDPVVVRRPRMAGDGSYSCPDPGGEYFWVVDYSASGSPIYKVPYATSDVQEPIGFLDSGLKPTYLQPHLPSYAGSCSPDWWNCSYTYRKVLKIIAPDRGLEASHPITVTMPKDDTTEQGKIRTDLADIEVIYHLEDDFYVVEHEIEQTATHITVTFPFLFSMVEGAVSEGEYYVYYGNPDLEDVPAASVYNPVLWPSALNLTTDMNYTMPGMDWDVISTQAVSNTINAKATATFYGNKIRIRADKNYTSGSIQIEVDGVSTLVDLYSVAPQYDVEVLTISGLSEEEHTLRIIVSNEKNPAAVGRTVTIRGVDVLKWSEAEIVEEEIIPLRWTSTVGSRH